MKQINYTKLGIALIIIAAILRFVFVLTYPVSGDACWHLASARFIATHNKMPLFEGLGRFEPFWPPPAFHFIAAFFYKISSFISLNFANLSLRLISPIMGTLTVIVAYLITRKVFDDRIAFYSMLFLNFVPLFLDYSSFSYVDSTAAFFSVLAIYLTLNNRYILSSASFGTALLSKYNVIFTLPMLLYLTYKFNHKIKRYSTMLIIIFLPLLIASVWLIRNFIFLGNPFWPFLNGVFKGVTIGTSFNAINFTNLFSFRPYLSSYLEFFGVPNGNIALLGFVNIPFMNYLLLIWFVCTLLFIFPLLYGFFSESKKGNKILINGIYILFLSYLLMLFIYLVNTNWFGSRLLLPVLPFIGYIWAKGINDIGSKKYLALVFLVALGFIAVHSAKIAIASKEWSLYNNDFEFARKNSKEDDIFYGNGQCLSYHIDRLVVQHTAELDYDKVDYVWVNNKWRIDFTMNEDSLNRIKNSNKLEIKYNNPNTGTIIYKVKR